jgi:hypothetical protein
MTKFKSILLEMSNFIQNKALKFKTYIVNRFKEKPISTVLIIIPLYFIGAPFVFIWGGWAALSAYLICKLTGVCPLP